MVYSKLPQKAARSIINRRKMSKKMLDEKRFSKYQESNYCAWNIALKQ